jgi:hypothetical protein
MDSGLATAPQSGMTGSKKTLISAQAEIQER